MPVHIDPQDIFPGTINATEFGYLDGVTSNIQTQLNTCLAHIAASGASHTFIDQAVTIAASPTFAALTIDSPNLVVNVPEYTDRVGIGTATPGCRLHVEDSDMVLKVKMVAAAVTYPMGVVSFVAKAITNMSDGFGGALTFFIEDDTSGEQNIAGIGAVRAGADNSGRMFFSTRNAGAAVKVLTVDKTGYAGVGIGDAEPQSRFEIKTGVTEGKVALTIDQNDSDQAFWNLEGTDAGAGIFDTGSIVNYRPVGEQKLVHIKLNGTSYSLIAYSVPS